VAIKFTGTLDFERKLDFRELRIKTVGRGMIRRRLNQSQRIAREIAARVYGYGQHLVRGRDQFHFNAGRANAPKDDDIVRRQHGRGWNAGRLARERAQKMKGERFLIRGYDFEIIDAIQRIRSGRNAGDRHALAAVFVFAMELDGHQKFRWNAASCRSCVRRTMYCTCTLSVESTFST
jgi:hypothetical protein